MLKIHVLLPIRESLKFRMNGFLWSRVAPRNWKCARMNVDVFKIITSTSSNRKRVQVSWNGSVVGLGQWLVSEQWLQTLVRLSSALPPTYQMILVQCKASPAAMVRIATQPKATTWGGRRTNASASKFGAPEACDARVATPRADRPNDQILKLSASTPKHWYCVVNLESNLLDNQECTCLP